MIDGFSSPSSSSSVEEEDEGEEEEAATEELRSLLPEIRGLLDEAETKAVPSNLDELNLRDLRAIFYDAEDAVHDLHHPRKRKRGDPPRCRTKARDVLQEFRSLITDSSSLSLDLNPRHSRQEEAERPLTGSISSARRIYGMEEDRDNIIDKILTVSSADRVRYLDKDCSADARYRNLTILPVARPGGIGKTTLVQHIYQDGRVKNHFGSRRWISCASNWGETGNRSLAGALSGERLLLVLDDAFVTNPSFWETFWHPIVSRVADGSIAIVTTRHLQVIEAMPRYVLRTTPYPLYPLDFDDCWSIFVSCMRSDIFKKTVFFEDDDDELVMIGKQIVGMYEGFPMDIKIAASKLRLSSNPEDWKERLREASSRDSYWMASYRVLRPAVKRCFMYCALFPEYYVFEKDYLIKLWVAEGIVNRCEETGKDCHEVGLDYFWELVHNFFLVHDEEYNYKFKMHLVVLNLAKSILGNFFCRLDDASSGKSLGEVRHVSFVSQENEIELNPENPETLHRLRSVLAIHSVYSNTRMKFSWNVAFDSMVYLRTLELSYTDIKEIPSSIGFLRSLRYLGLKATLIETLPDSVCTLQNLQVLELELCRKLKELPRSIGRLVSLQHLGLDRDSISFCMPCGFGELTNLQSLPVFKVPEGPGENSGLRELSKLVNLRNELLIMGIRYSSFEDSKLACLDNKKSLKTLRFCWSSSPLALSQYQYSKAVSEYQYGGINMKKEEQVLENLMPNASLENLTIQSYSGSILPEWIASRSFTKLKFINLKDCINCKILPSLGRLPSLKRLFINCPAIVEINDLFCGGSGGFPLLDELMFSGMLKLEKWTGVQENDFRELKQIEFINCPRLVQVPQIASLESLKIESCKEVEVTSRCSSLQVLLIHASGFSELPTLESLVSLSLMHCKGPIHIRHQPKLKDLWIEDCDQLICYNELNMATQLDSLFSKKKLDSLFVANCQVQILPPEKVQGLNSFYNDGHTLSFEEEEEEEEEEEV